MRLISGQVFADIEKEAGGFYHQVSSIRPPQGAGVQRMQRGAPQTSLMGSKETYLEVRENVKAENSQLRYGLVSRWVIFMCFQCTCEYSGNRLYVQYVSNFTIGSRGRAPKFVLVLLFCTRHFLHPAQFVEALHKLGGFLNRSYQ